MTAEEAKTGKPFPPDDRIAASLNECYGISVDSVNQLPLGYDSEASVYEVIAEDGTAYFLKIRSGPPNEPSVSVPRALIDHGVENVLAPIKTLTADLWCPVGAHAGVLYPFLEGQNAAKMGMSDRQWREFGATLRSVHNSGLAERFRGQVPAETFSLASAPLVRHLQALKDNLAPDGPAAALFIRCLRDNAGQIGYIVDRAEALGKRLQAKQFEYVLCHADIHAANILVSEDDRISLIDWDNPLIAPRERDLLFVIGSQIARRVEPREEELFFEGYGATDVDWTALAYYRYERAIEDIGEFGKSILFDPSLTEKAEQAELVTSFFRPGNIIAWAMEADKDRP